ncbi:response regulator transcription factor [Brevibacillus dissolubilis]|uniref:response regulator transcription factor n=1 Tax=Brevibacillus dissolubilis TaxID=1844116 RepID=UPI0011160193|nr:response regulator transcription factor [Brevibacillus dissolubilis]
MNQKSSPATILVADNEPAVLEVISVALTREGYHVIPACDGMEALEVLRSQPVDLAILDIMMPRLTGFDVCRIVRGESDIPILFLSGLQNEVDKVLGLGLGADDYIMKPFGIAELNARVAANLRRYRGNPFSNGAGTGMGVGSDNSMLHFGPIQIDVKGFTILVDGTPLPFSQKEFEIVCLLALSPGTAFSREQIYEKIWGAQPMGETATVTEHIKKIRQKFLQAIPGFDQIKTIWGVGYKWEKDKAG